MDEARRDLMVSCILPARSRSWVAPAISLFLKQDYEPRELIVMDVGEHAVGDLVSCDERVRYIRIEGEPSLGAVRNFACEQARGEIVVHWEERSWYSPEFLLQVVEGLSGGEADLAIQDPIPVLDLTLNEGFRVDARNRNLGFLAYLRAFQEDHPFDESSEGSTRTFVEQGRLAVLPNRSRQVVIGWPEGAGPRDEGVEPCPADELRELLGEDSELLREPPVAPEPPTPLQLHWQQPLPVDEVPNLPRDDQKAPLCQEPTRITEPAPGLRPLVSCIMPTRNRGRFVPLAVRCFLAQDYDPRELIIVDDGTDPVDGLIPRDERIRTVKLDRRLSIGAKRNLTCAEARGEIIIHWDDDDWHAPHRIQTQVDELLRLNADLCGLDPLPVLDLRTGLGWSYRCPIHEGLWAAGGSLCYRRTLWERNRFPDVDLAEDRQFIWNAAPSRLVNVPGGPHLVAMLHGANAALKEPAPSSCWGPRDTAEIVRIMGEDYPAYRLDSDLPKPGQSLEPPRRTPKVSSADPHVSCIMPTFNRRRFVPLAIQYFLRQDYEQRELVIIDDGTDPVEDLIPQDDRFRYVRIAGKISVGTKRNLACELSRGELVVHWDDDDWQASHRISTMVRTLLREDAELCGLNPLLFYDIGSGLGWQYRYPPDTRFWVAGTSFCYQKRFWDRNRFADIEVGEDNRFVWNDPSARMCVEADSSLQVAILHDQNGSPKATSSAFWTAHPANEIRDLLGPDASFYRFEPPLAGINLGCGEHHVKGLWNVDVAPPADQIVDLRCAWPWAGSCVDTILARDVIEHLPDKIHTLNEAWRVLRPGGRLEISVPTTEGSGAFQDPTHVSFWNRRSFLYFEKGNIHRERFAERYGIEAAFRVVSESTEMTESGPQLTIVLEAVK